ncbi:MAG TPA: NAD-dependent epimerase/dehydratase family protein [Eoetvoesiella sp.]
MLKILITGAAGFLGVALTKTLAERGDTVIALDLKPSPQLQWINTGYKYYL